jgi:hypothetical protein
VSTESTLKHGIVSGGGGYMLDNGGELCYIVSISILLKLIVIFFMLFTKFIIYLDQTTIYCVKRL